MFHACVPPQSCCTPFSLLLHFAANAPRHPNHLPAPPPASPLSPLLATTPVLFCTRRSTSAAQVWGRPPGCGRQTCAASQQRLRASQSGRTARTPGCVPAILGSFVPPTCVQPSICMHTPFIATCDSLNPHASLQKREAAPAPRKNHRHSERGRAHCRLLLPWSGPATACPSVSPAAPWRRRRRHRLTCPARPA
jgi:hypothetical protein